VLVVQPDNWWFKGVNSEAVIDAILDGLENNEPAADHLIS
jgi:(2Fe-2S) ferredoxin